MSSETGKGVDVMAGVPPAGVTVVVGVVDNVTICGSKVQVGALVREGKGEIVAGGVQVASRGITTNVLVGVSVR
jgi:hypothetical protein